MRKMLIKFVKKSESPTGVEPVTFDLHTECIRPVGNLVPRVSLLPAP